MSEPQSHNGHTQIDDTSQRSDGGGANVRVQLVGYDRPFFTALALVISIAAASFAWWTEDLLNRDIYWRQRIEAFLEQLSAQGVHVPPDILHHEEKH